MRLSMTYQNTLFNLKALWNINFIHKKKNFDPIKMQFLEKTERKQSLAGFNYKRDQLTDINRCNVALVNS